MFISIIICYRQQLCDYKLKYLLQESINVDVLSIYIFLIHISPLQSLLAPPPWLFRTRSLPPPSWQAVCFRLLSLCPVKKTHLPAGPHLSQLLSSTFIPLQSHQSTLSKVSAFKSSLTIWMPYPKRLLLFSRLV